MSRAEELFDAERTLRQAAVGYSNARSGAITDRKELEELRKALRSAALHYAAVAGAIESLGDGTGES